MDPKVTAGFRDLERRLSDEELVKDLRDYRRFFDFDLHMRNERGQETTLSKRSVTGSGGQKQAPYYVAVGAALAAAYYPKSAFDSPDGFGLVVFDEAFNNLDAPNTRALLEFFRDLHLQVVVAAPDKVRAMFLENADTIVSVSLSRPIRSVLTVENLESFNRHVRTCRMDSDVVVYTGGFPSRSVLTLLRTVMENTGQGLYHWGDIDPGGIRIGCNLEAALSVAISPHLMTPSLAANFGKKPTRDSAPLRTSETSGFADLAHYLNQPDARWLEQENIDPSPLSCA